MMLPSLGNSSDQSPLNSLDLSFGFLHLAKEYLDAEVTFNTSMLALMQKYMMPMSIFRETVFDQTRVLSLRKYGTLFRNVALIYSISNIFMHELFFDEQAKRKITLLDVLYNVYNNLWLFNMYNYFLNSYFSAQQLLHSLEGENKMFAEVKKMASETINVIHPNHMSELESLLIAPVQHLPNLMLIFQNLQKQIFEEYMNQSNGELEMTMLSKCLNTSESIISKIKVILHSLNANKKTAVQQ